MVDEKSKEPLREVESVMITNKGTAYSAEVMRSSKMGHTGENYKIVSDVKDDQGRRVITLEPVDDKELSRKTDAIVRTILRKLGESRSRVTKGLLRDVMRDYYPETIQRLYEKIVEKGFRVKSSEGCFKIEVGDMRTRDSAEIMLRG